MSAHRFAVLAGVLLTACVSRGAVTSTSTGTVPQERGPKGYIQAQYTGDFSMRSVSASFGVDRSAFVIVGHLGGDGVIRVLYPEIPSSYGYLINPLPGGKTVWTQPFFAEYDAAPSLYTFSVTPFRNIGAMTNSYDGRGHGFLFIIASSAPLRYELVTGEFGWVDVPVVDYFRMADPRLAIKKFADLLARRNYTLRFATSYTTKSFTSYATHAWDCATLTTMGLNNLHGFWGLWGIAGLSGLGYSGSHYNWSGCRDPFRYALNDFYFFRSGTPGYRTAPAQLIPTKPPILTPPPTSGRPTYHPFGDRAATSQSAFDRSGPIGRAGGINRDRPSWPTSDDRRASTPTMSGPMVYRSAEGERSYAPRVSDYPRTVGNDQPSSQAPRATPPPPPAPAATERPSASSSATTPATRPATNPHPRDP